ncbi:MAG TPA: iron-containing alcohol dehydrogenase [Thermoanaerobaculia bacterium]|nr:iron-containing alcohol dehydrogenase [Thermoanaerobaculia bacterium]
MKLRVPPTLLFGRGRLADVAAILDELGAERPLVVTDPGVVAAGIAERLLGHLREAGHHAEVWDGVAPDPDEGHAERCRDRILEGGHGSVVALGGGSAIDAAKVAAVLATSGGKTSDYFGFDTVRRPGLPLVTVPTTPGSGAEVSSHAVIVQLSPRKKEVVAGLHLLPRAAIVDPELTLTLPAPQTTWSALDGFVHAVEAFLARRATPLTDSFARPAVPAIARALPRVLADGADMEAREDLSLGCLYSGLAMANANAGAIHALGYPLTGRYGIPHGLANALVAAPTLERIWPGRPERCAELARLLGNEGAGAGPEELAANVRRFLVTLGVRGGLSGHGVCEEDLPELAEAATRFRPVLDNTPVALGREDLLAVYRAAWPGD